MFGSCGTNLFILDYIAVQLALEADAPLKSQPRRSEDFLARYFSYDYNFRSSLIQNHILIEHLTQTSEAVH